MSENLSKWVNATGNSWGHASVSHQPPICPVTNYFAMLSSDRGVANVVPWPDVNVDNSMDWCIVAPGLVPAPGRLAVRARMGNDGSVPRSARRVGRRGCAGDGGRGAQCPRRHMDIREPPTETAPLNRIAAPWRECFMPVISACGPQIFHSPDFSALLM